MNMYLSILEPDFALQISQPPKIARNWFCTQNFDMDLSSQKKKNSLEICSWVLEILSKQTFLPFFETPCILLLELIFLTGE